MNQTINFLKSVYLAFIPTLGLKHAKQNHNIGTKTDILYLAILIAIPGFFSMLFASFFFFANPDKYFDDFPAFKILNGNVETEIECDSKYEDEESGLALYFVHCSESIPNDLPVNSVIISSKHISVVRKSGEIRSFPAGTFGDWDFTSENIQQWIKLGTIPAIILGFLVMILFQFIIRKIEIFIISIFYNLFKNIKNAEENYKNSLNGIIFLAIIPSALIDAFFGKFEIINSITFYIFIFYIILYLVLLIKDIKKKEANVG
ncbi:hypothetical protein EHQ31_06485 [Leptospira montravelensis]|uniref:DUF1189 domain-containing protein n=1 Tax=Leptospira montravelensis TaxID=2484961 RepID=A0ABY2LVT0_9LEPT|nr:hypothetical protein [Leptospira montravelensis]TGK84322.1 hypothetical protein EHQ19_07450 [Leptospira montravelensis]TGL06332.1 hypothetical protein EHQ31_06485 [Leptospira montravelensis]